MILYTNWLIPDRFADINLGVVTLIRPRFKNDAGLHAHVGVHDEQFRKRPFTHHLRYLLDHDYRLACEVEAYKVQLLHSPHDVSRFAESLSSKYHLKITQAEAMELLNDTAR